MVKRIISKKWRANYRTLMILATFLAFFAHTAEYYAYAIHSEHFPQQSHLYEKFLAYGFLLVAIICLCESISLFILRRFARTI
jgi:hypothetical protein